MTAPRTGILTYFRTSPTFTVLFLVMFTATAGMGIVGPLLPVYAEKLGASGLWLGLAFSGFAVTQTPLMPVFGRLSDRFGRKPFLAGGVLVYALVATGMAFAPNFHVLIALRLCGGVGAAMLFPVAMAYAGEMSPEGEEGRFMGLFNVATMIGWGMGPLTGGLLSDHFGMAAAFLSQAALAGFAFVTVLLRLPSTTRRKSAAGQRQEGAGASLLRSPVVWALSAFQFAWAANQAILVSFSALYLTSNLGAAAAMVGVIFSTRQIVSGLLQPLGGRLADSFNRTLLIVLGATIAGIASFSVPFAGSALAVLLIFIVSGASESLSVPAVNAIAVEQGRSLGMGSLMGFINTAMSVGLVLGGVGGGLVKDTFDIQGTFQFAGLLTLVGAVILLLAMPRGLGRRAVRATEAAVVLEEGTG
ncbi:MAG: MFS transporter [Dehalococcoidia bacterium]|nr:MFS transporter [Dehalococcoidia bacterium]